MSRARKKLEEMLPDGGPLTLDHIAMWKQRCPDVQRAAQMLAKDYGAGVFTEDVAETLIALYAATTPEEVVAALDNDMSGVADILSSWLPG